MVWSPTIAMAGGFVVAWFAYVLAPSTPAFVVGAFWPIHAFLYNKWYIDELYDWIFVRPYRWLARTLWKVGDGAIIDGLGPDGIAARVMDVTNRTVKAQTGYVYHYAFTMFAGIVLLVSYFFYLYTRAL